MKTNVKTRWTEKTHEGATAAHISKEQGLRRTLMACMLWEDSFYEDGQSVADRIAALVPYVKPERVAEMAVEARGLMKLRHAPLLVAVEMLKSPIHRPLVGKVLEEIIQRPDELAEFLSLYWKGGKCPLAKQAKIGLAAAFRKFNAYELAKYNRDGAIKLRDVLFICHAKPKDEDQAATWKKLVDGTLEAPDTWEVSLSGGQDKKETWERLLREGKLGALALLRNLRNMKQVGVGEGLIRDGLKGMKVERVLPFRFITAARYAPLYEPELEGAMFKCLETFEKLKGKTAVLVDNSGSMLGAKVSLKSELDRSDAACALAMLVREVCETPLVIGFGNRAEIIPARRGFALAEAIKGGPGGGTYTEVAKQLADREGYDRIIIITDEQSHTSLSAPLGKGYVINVATYQNGVGYGRWTHIDGWSEQVLDFIRAYESQED